MGLLHERAAARVARRMGSTRSSSTRRSATAPHLRRARLPGRASRRGPAHDLRLPSVARERQPLGGRPPRGARAALAAQPSARTRTGCSVSPGRRAALLARAERDGLDRMRHGLVVSCVGDPGRSRTSAAGGGRRGRPGGRPRLRPTAGEHVVPTGCPAAATSGSSARRASTSRSAALAHAGRALPRVPLVRRRPRVRPAGGARRRRSG